MHLAAYRASRGKPLDWLIALRHLGPHSHTELVFSDGVSFSASWRDGVRFTSGIDWHSGKWDLVGLTFVAPDQETRIRAWCEQHQWVSPGVRRRYDWRGVLAYVNPLRRQTDEAYYCSESNCLALMSEGFFAGVEPGKVWPSRLYQMCKREVARRGGHG